MLVPRGAPGKVPAGRVRRHACCSERRVVDAKPLKGGHALSAVPGALLGTRRRGRQRQRRAHTKGGVGQIRRAAPHCGLGPHAVPCIVAKLLHHRLHAIPPLGELLLFLGKQGVGLDDREVPRLLPVLKSELEWLLVKLLVGVLVGVLVGRRRQWCR